MRHLGICTPPSALIHVSREFLDRSAEVFLSTGKERLGVETGVHFGSRYPGHPDTTIIHDFLPDPWFARTVNRTDFIGALVFDRWVNNTDGPQTIFAPLTTMSPGHTQFQAMMIDRGHAFGGTDWILRDSPLAGIHTRRSLYDDLRGISDCEPWISGIESIQDRVLLDIIETIPHSWRREEDRCFERMVADLLRARCRVADSIIASANSSERPFRNWVSRTVRKPSVRARPVSGTKYADERVYLTCANDF